MSRIAIPSVTTLIVVASLLALSGWNRAAGPRSLITVTERELSLPFNAADRNALLHLALQVERRDDPLDARNWLREDRLREIGFNVEVPAAAPEASYHYGRALPRVAWVAFQYDGDAWREIERRRALAPPPREPWRRPMPTRLVPVDAAADLDVLLLRYPRAHLMLRAVIGLAYRGPKDGGPLVYGWIRQLVPAGIAVPNDLRGRLDGLQHVYVTPGESAPNEPREEPPRYEVDVAVGRLGIPYVTDIRRLR